MNVARTRMIVMLRDGGCVAPQIDRHAGPCYDQWGKIIRERDKGDPRYLEMDYVRLGAHGARHELPEDHCAVCPGHHRGTGPSAGYQWATSHRGEMRAWLDEHGSDEG